MDPIRLGPDPDLFEIPPVHRARSTVFNSLQQWTQGQQGTVNLDWRAFRGLTTKQNAALDLCIAQAQAKVLYGGAGFGGKSYLLRSASVFFAGLLATLGFPGQIGMLVCKDYPSLRDRHAPALAREFQDLGEIHTADKHYGYCFRFNDKRLGALRLRNADEADKYRGTENAYLLVDELTELPKTVLGDLLYCLRSPDPLPFLPFLAASNPDGLGHPWVKKLWVSRDFQGENLDPADFHFIQALPQDNPTFQDNQYAATLAGLPEWKRKARMEGSWDTPTGARFPQLDSQTHLFAVQDLLPHGLNPDHHLIMGVDWGIRDPYCALWILELDGDWYVVREDYQPDLSSDRQVQRIMQLTKPNERISKIYADSQMWEKRRDPHSQFAARGISAADVYSAELRSDDRFHLLIPAYKGRRQAPLDTLDRLFNRNNGYPDLYIEHSCTQLWRELTGAVWADSGREDIDPRQADHAITALYYALHTHLNAIPRPATDLQSRADDYGRSIIKAENAELRRLARSVRGGQRLF